MPPRAVPLALQRLRGARVEFVEQPGLPGGHRGGRCGREVGHGEEEERLQPPRVAHEGRHLRERRRVGEVSAGREVVEREVLEDEPGHRRGVLGVEPEAGGDRRGHLRAHLAVRAAVALADVVQQRREQQHLAAVDAGHQPGGQREVRPQLAAAEGVQPVDRGHRVNVHRVHVIDVVLDARCHRGELGDEGEHEAEVVEVGEHAPRVVRGARDRGAIGARRRAVRAVEQAEEAAAGLARPAEPIAPGGVGRGAGDAGARRGRDREVVHQRGLDQPQRQHRVALEAVR